MYVIVFVRLYQKIDNAIIFNVLDIFWTEILKAINPGLSINNKDVTIELFSITALKTTMI